MLAVRRAGWDLGRRRLQRPRRSLIIAAWLNNSCPHPAQHPAFIPRTFCPRRLPTAVPATPALKSLIWNAQGNQDKEVGWLG